MQAYADLLDVGCQKGESGKGGGADGKAFSGGGGGVAERVEGVGAASHFGSESAHFGVAAGIVGDRSVGIGGQSDAESGEHTHGGDAYAVETPRDVGEVKA
ncbi:hypothetical protein IMSAGC006_01845 [Muribaculaceae bacterium]|nr:hypothetical protein IMSAGC006_01845 [Muribaculaceae bacterium]